MRHTLLLFCVAALGLCRTPGAWAACQPLGPVTLGLRVIPGEMAAPGTTLEVALHANGCVRVQRPAHWRQAGHYTADSDAALASLQARAGLDQRLASLDSQALLAALARRDQQRGAFFEVADADLYTIDFRAADGRMHQFSMPALLQYAERHPDSAELAELRDLVRTLSDQARRTDLTPVAELPR